MTQRRRDTSNKWNIGAYTYSNTPVWKGAVQKCKHWAHTTIYALISHHETEAQNNLDYLKLFKR